MSAQESIVSVRDVTKVYGGGLFGRGGFRALDGVSLEVGRGQVFGLLGPNGAGKTTLVKILLGLARRSGGDARIFGQPVGDPRARTRVGYLPEGHRFPGYLTGVQMLELFGQMCGRDRHYLRRRIPELLEQVGMRDSAHRKIREYSKGMTQRIGLAQAMVHEPELVILDEPTDGVDPVGRAAVRALVQGLKDRGTTVFINSHLLQEVELVCDRVVIMARGKILREGSIAELTPRSGRYRFEVAPCVELTLARLVGELGSNFEPATGGFEVQLSDAELDACVDRLRAGGISIRGITARRMNLEQAFIQLVNKEAR
ncbi:MAG: ABC transporter ATP-binding protein [Planctomycetes bacterium]|nr:ABC transporter ATP-binding protein [Planctomycetota bacterium]